jgi:hypothetical protein
VLAGFLRELRLNGGDKGRSLDAVRDVIDAIFVRVGASGCT